MGETQHKKTKTSSAFYSFYSSHLGWTIAGMALRYILLSVLISLFFENTLIWMFLATVGVTAWSMYRIAMHDRASLPTKLWRKWKKYEKENREFDLLNAQERKEWKQIEEYKKKKYHEKPFQFQPVAWVCLLVPLIGSSLLQILYFWGIGEPVQPGLLVTWVLSNLLLTFFFSLIGAVSMAIFLFQKQKKENTQHTQKIIKSDTQWITRIVSSIVLFFYVSTLLLPGTVPVLATPPDCSKENLTPEELIGCYDEDTDYEVRGEPVNTEPERRIPLDPGSGNTSGNENNGAGTQPNLEEYYSQFPNIPPEQINELYQLCQSNAGCNFEELLNEYQNEIINLPVLENESEEDPNILLATLEGLGGAGQDTWNFITTEGGKGLNYLKENWNNPGKMGKDGLNAYLEFGVAQHEGRQERIKAKQKGLQDTGNWFQTKWQQYTTDPGGQFQKDVSWANEKVIQPWLAHGAHTQQYIQKNPQDAWMMNNIFTSWYFHGKVAIDTHYDGGLKQFKKDAAVALADKNTYWAVLSSPFSERTKELIAERKLAQALGRGVGELSVEAGQEVVETAATGGVGKVGLVVVGFVVDARKVAKKTDKLSDAVELAAKYQDNIPTEEEIKKAGSLKRFYERESRKVFASDDRLKHIVSGDKAPGKNGGYHLQKAGDENTYVVPGTESPVNDYGVYEAQVVVNGTMKQTNGGKSTFFPKNWSEQDIVNAVNEAHEFAIKNGCTSTKCTGFDSKGMEITIIFENNNSGKIWAAYPEL